MKKLLLLTLSAKIIILLLIFFAFNTLQFCTACHEGNFHYPRFEQVTLFTAFKTWDAQHFLYLAEKWYSPGIASNAFYPLYPFLVRAFAFVFFGNFLAAGLLLSAFFSFIAVIFLYLLVKKIFNEKIAFTSCLFFIAFPTAFFTSLVYTEALFLALVLGFFYFLFERKPALAAVFAFLLPLAKPQGILVMLPLLVFFFSEFFVKGEFKPGIKKEHFLIVVFLLGFSAYLGVMHFSTGNAFAAFEAEKAWGNSIERIFKPQDYFFKELVETNLKIHGYYDSALERFFFIFFLISLFFIFKHLNKTFFAYAFFLGLIPVLSGNFASYSRHLLIIFPIFVILALKFEKNKELILIPSIMLQALFLVIHSLNYWIA